MSRKNPYVGPRSFQRTDEDKSNFFGRPREVERLLNLLIAERIVLLHSPSGAGKTSLINAGLIPELEEEQFVVLPVMRVNRFLPPDKLQGITVSNRYIFSALLYLEGYEEEESKDRTSSDRLKQLAAMKFGDYLNSDAMSKDKQIVLIFDQFEEILTSNPTDFAEKLEFFQQVGTALRDNNRWALFSMREDYVASLGSLLRPMPTRLSTRFKLELLTRKWAREAIEKPADKDVRYDKQVVDKLTDDLATVKAPNYDGTGATTDVVGEYVEPMQLQVVCLRLWETLTFPKDPEQKIEVKVTDLKSTHVDSSLAAFYESCLDEVTGMQDRGEAEIRQWIQSKLITSAGTRGLVFMGEADGMPKEIVDTLEQRHLLRSEQRGGSRWVELTHDRFIKPIQDSNRPWLALNGLDRKTRRARVVAFSWFIVLILFWAFIEWFMIIPFRESQRYWMELDAINAIQRQSDVTEKRAVQALQAAENSDDTLRNTLINDTKSDLEAALKQPQARRHGKENGKLRKRAKLLARGAKKFESVSSEASDLCSKNDCSGLRKALEHLETDSENNWKSFSLSDDDVRALLGATTNSILAVTYFLERTGGEQVANGDSGRRVIFLQGSTKQSTDSDRLPLIQEFVRKADPKQQDFKIKSEEVRLRLMVAERKLQKAREQKNWTNLQFDQELRAVEESTEFNFKFSLDPLRKYEQKNYRRSDWLNEKEKQIKGAKWKYAAVSPLSILRPEQMTILLYGLWCLLLVFYIGYLANAMGGAEQVVSGLDLTHTKVDISDALGWRLTHPAPPMMTIVAVCCLLLIHVGPTWLAYEVLRAPGSDKSGLVVLMVMPFVAAIYYARRRFNFARSLQIKELEPGQASASIVSPGPV